MKKGLLFIAILITGVNAIAQTNDCNNNAGGEIIVGASCTPIAWDSNNNTNYWDGATGCSATDNDDVWGWFTATGTTTTITYQPATNRDAILTVFGPNTACNVNMTSAACSNAGADGVAETISGPTTPGSVYRIRVQRNGSNNSMTGTICVYSPGPPNDLCANATALPCGTTNLAGTTVGTSNIAPGAGTCSVSNYGVWYTFTGNGQQTTISCTASGGWDHEMDILSGNCGSFTTVQCDDGALTNGTETHTFTATNGVTYYVYIAHWSSGSTTTGPFTISRTCSAPPANDDCTGAFPVTVNPSTTCTSTTAGTVAAATASSQSAAACAGTEDDDVWFSFTATNTIHNIDLLNIAGSTTNLDHSVWEGTCPGSLTLFPNSCSAANSSIITGLTIGQTYYIRVYTNTATGGQTTTFDVCITTPPPPVANDDCGGAYNVTVNPNQTCTFTTAGTVVNAYPSSQSTTACGGTEDDDVWFSFTATHTTHYIDLLNVAGSTIDLYHSVWSGTCPTLSLVAGSCSDPNSSTVTGLTIGQTYYIRVYTYTATGGQTTTFDVCVTSPPPPPTNDDPCNATPAVVNTGATCVSVNAGYCVGATQTLAGCVGTADDDVWFSFTALSTDHDISLLNINGTTTDMVHELFSGPCGSLTSLGCSDPNNSSHSGLTIGQTYFVRVYTYSGTATNTSFDLCITSPCGTTGAPSCSLNYTHSAIAYNPFPYQVGNQHSFTDDEFYSSYTSIGFDFCFDGIIYQDVLISSNGYLLFPGCYSAHPYGNAVTPNDYSEYSISAAAPNTTDAPVNAILGPWQDIYPSSNVADGDIRSGTTGASPNRIFGVTFYEVRMFSCTTDDFNGQIKLFETTDNIEIHIGEKTVCAGFNSGAAIMGLTDYTGTVAVIPAGYNYPTQWTVNPGSPEGHRFTSNCGPCTVLPVELIEFTGTNYDAYNLLNWKTESETNNSHFVIEKSNGGAMFEEVASIPGAGNSSNLLTYELKHYNPRELEYYRLRQVDFDGKWAYSKIISVRREPTLVVDIYPNPSTGDLYFDISKSENGLYLVKLTDLTGRVKVEQIIITEGVNKYKLNMFNELESGIYFVQISDENGSLIKTDKIIKQ